MLIREYLSHSHAYYHTEVSLRNSHLPLLSLCVCVCVCVRALSYGIQTQCYQSRHMCHNQTLQEVAMLRSHQFTQIQRFPANSARRCNFNTSPPLSRNCDKSLSSPTTFSLPLHQGSGNSALWTRCRD